MLLDPLWRRRCPSGVRLASKSESLLRQLQMTSWAGVLGRAGAQQARKGARESHYMEHG